MRPKITGNVRGQMGGKSERKNGGKLEGKRAENVNKTGEMARQMT